MLMMSILFPQTSAAIFSIFSPLLAGPWRYPKQFLETVIAVFCSCQCLPGSCVKM